MAMPIPSLSFDFAGQPDSLDPRITFTRASIGSYYDANQILRYRPANAPRFTHGANGVCNGLHQEQNGINRLLWSEAFDNAVWTNAGVTVTANTTIAPDGNQTADTLTANAGGNGMWQSAAITAGNTVAFQVYVMAGATNWTRLLIYDPVSTASIQCWFDLVNNVVGTQNHGPGGNVAWSSASMEVLPGGWRRVRLTATTATITNVNCYVGPAPADNTLQVSGNSCNAWGAQLMDFPAAQAFAGSYMPTTSATATRQMETTSINNLDPSWWNPLAGTVVGSAVNFMNGTDYFFGIGNTTNDYLQLVGGPAGGNSLVVGQIFSGGVNQGGVAVTGGSTWVYSENDVPLNFAMAWQNNDIAVAANGVALTKVSNTTLPTSMVRFKIGGAGWSASNSSIQGQLRRIAYYPTRLPNAQLQALTAG